MQRGTRNRGRGRSLTRCAAAVSGIALIAAACCTVPAAAAATPGAGAAAASISAPAPDILTAPTLIASTAKGDVAYRTVGHGRPLLLIMGYGGSMDDWAPSFVDALAAHFRVIVFDNAGVGQTSALPAPLDVPAMAEQTSALISSLRLHRPTVLGWSMGGMIAQALAVRHPGQVGRLVLAATQAGTGMALPIPAAAAAALNSPNPAVVLSVLFPADQLAALRAYAAQITQYPNFYAAPSTVKAEQTAAIQEWMAGDDPVGHRLNRIHVPTLVADGTEDALNPAANAVLLAHGIPRSRLLLDPDAGHAFLFQDAATFVPAVTHFANGA
ncbi:MULTISPECIES: alpha/beta fold hydrolase [Streptacidiphilus]|uniref:Alpha/beta fold hydrolase n=1 Tax=Streptacidiphilus cavernicola TaxID=3342716 RepID=A0ABV6UGZ4_9ACTN|nr:alpha/beta hydrolase [Streptacidiphilus jeojiense]